MHKNLDLVNLVTPVNADKLEQFLHESSYDPVKTQFLVEGFRKGFDLGYRGRRDVKITSHNLKFHVGNEVELWNKVMKEVGKLRYAGPFENIPFDEFYIQSPIGLVPKDHGKSTRLIFHLSYPRDDSKTSVNTNIPKEMCSVRYPDFADAVKLCIHEGRGCYCSKSDWTSAFRHFPIKRECWNVIVMKAKCPVDSKWYYFIDKCMPFGSSISCALFQTFSDAVAHVMKYKTKRDNVNYLDDFLFIAFLKWLCDKQVQIFLEVCQEIQFPVAMDKTCWGTNLIVFLGMLLDTVNQRVLIPIEKLNKALSQIDKILNSKKRKATVIQIQKLCGILNFLCRTIVPGRPFLMRLYQSLSGIKAKNTALKPYHHVRVAEDMILDLQVWRAFLTSAECYARPFMDYDSCDNAKTLDWYTDLAKALGKGFGGHHQDEWFWGAWSSEFLAKDPSIGFLELYAVTIGVLLWAKRYPNQRILLFCDNESVVHMVNKQSSEM